MKISGTTGKYGFALYTKSSFDKSYGSAEKFLASNYIPNKKADGAEPHTKNATYTYSKLSPGPRVVVIYGVDDDYDFTGEYNLIEFDIPQFTTPEDWHLTFKPSYVVNGEPHPAVHVQVPAGTSYSTGNLKKTSFLSNYGGDVVAYIWSQITGTSTIRTSTDINLYFNSLDETDYVYIVYGVHEREQEGENRTLTYEYAMLEYTYTKPSDAPTEAYSAWLGKWEVTESSGETPYTDTWTITAKTNNASYTITGLVKRTSWEVLATLEEDGTLLIKAQKDIATTTTSNGYEASVNLYGKRADGKTYTGTYDLMRATLDGENPANAVLAPPSSTSLYISYLFYGTYTDSEGNAKAVTWTKGTRSNSATMTRVNEEGVLAPDGWTAEAEDFTTNPEPFELDEVIPAE